MKTRIDALLPDGDRSWPDRVWGEVELVLDERCSREELIWLGDTAGVVIPLPTGDREFSKPEILLLLRDMPPRVLAARYRALLEKRRNDGPRRYPRAV